MPQISKVGAGWGASADYATLSAWWATEAAIDYGVPIEASCLGTIGAGETLSGTSVNGAIVYTDSVVFDGTNESSLAVAERITISVTNSLTFNDLKITTANQYVSGFSLSSDTFTSNRCIFDNQTAGVNAILINGYYPNTTINNFVARGGLDSINAGYLRGTNFNKGIVYGAAGFGINGSAGGTNFQVTDVFAFGNGTDYDTANMTLNTCASQDSTGSSGLTGYTSAELVDFANGDLRTKSTSALATAGSVDYIGAFVEVTGGSLTITLDSTVTSVSIVNTPEVKQDKLISLTAVSSVSLVNQPEVKQDKLISLTTVPSVSLVYQPSLSQVKQVLLSVVNSNSIVYTPVLAQDKLVSLSYVPSASTVYTPNVKGSLFIELPKITSVSYVYEPILKEPQRVFPASVNSESLVYYHEVIGGYQPFPEITLYYSEGTGVHMRSAEEMYGIIQQMAKRIEKLEGR